MISLLVTRQNACQKMRPDMLKMHQTAFGGLAPPGTRLSAPQRNDGAYTF